MASKRNRGSGNRTDEARDWRALAPALGMVALVLGVLAVTAMLRVPDGPMPSSVNRAAAGRDVAPSQAREETPMEAPVDIANGSVVPEPPPSTSTPEGRALRDLARIAESRDAWTLQVLVACEETTLTRLTDRLGPRPDLYVLPYDRDGRPCYRVCWGVFPTRAAAESASGLPPELGAGLGPPVPKEVSLVAP